MRTGITFALLVVLGCGEQSAGPGMGGGGTPTAVSDLNDNGQDNSGGDDTGGANGSAPVISGVSGSWDGDADPPRVLIAIDVSDPDGDLHNGKVGISVDGSAEEWFVIQDPEMDGASDFIEALYDPEAGQVEVTAELDDGMPMDVSLTLRVKDAAMNVSDPYDFTPQ